MYQTVTHKPITRLHFLYQADVKERKTDAVSLLQRIGHEKSIVMPLRNLIARCVKSLEFNSENVRMFAMKLSDRVKGSRIAETDFAFS